MPDWWEVGSVFDAITISVEAVPGNLPSTIGRRRHFHIEERDVDVFEIETVGWSARAHISDRQGVEGRTKILKSEIKRPAHILVEHICSADHTSKHGEVAVGTGIKKRVIAE